MTSRSFKYSQPVLQGLTETASCRTTNCKAGASANYFCSTGAINVGCGNCAANCTAGTQPNNSCHNGGANPWLLCYYGNTDTTIGCCKNGTSAGKSWGCANGSVHYNCCSTGFQAYSNCQTGATIYNNCVVGPCG